jgi:LDH2 family malate/lactate/ureidoglycolate dehydrogenase
MLPAAGPKGSGLALAIEILVAILAEADFDDEVASIYETGQPRAQNLGQLFVVIDPWCVADPARTNARLAGLARRLHSLAPASGFPGARYAGEGAAQRARERERSGIPVPAGDLEAAAQACAEFGLPGLALLFRTLLAQ